MAIHAADRARPAERAPGVAGLAQEAMAVLDPDTMKRVPSDGETVGEIMFRGNITMKGYLKIPPPRKRLSPGVGSTPGTSR